MVARKKTSTKTNTSSKRRVKKRTTGRAWFLPGVGRLLVFFLLFFVLVFSLCSAGYVIFFRTVFAQEIMPVLKSSIVFEEPDPPEIVDLHTITTEQGIDIAQPPEEEKAVAILPKVAIIVDDIGYQRELGKAFLDMPIELTFSFLPFAPHTKELERRAYDLGKTVFLHLPLQPQSGKFNPGPGALLVQDSPHVQRDKLLKCLAEVPHATGVNNHMGSLFTRNKEPMVHIMEELESRSLAFVDSYTTATSVGLESAREQGLRSARRHVFLDNIQSRDHVCGQLQKLVDIAKNRGVGIGIAHPYKVTLEALKTCSLSYIDDVQYVSVMDVL